MDTAIYVLIGLGLRCLLAHWVGCIARGKGRYYGRWFFFGLMSWLVALICVACVGKVVPKAESV
jgi:hypothetical protein